MLYSNAHAETLRPLDRDSAIDDIFEYESVNLDLGDAENRRIELEQLEDCELEILHESIYYAALSDMELNKEYDDGLCDF